VRSSASHEAGFGTAMSPEVSVANEKSNFLNEANRQTSPYI
jgi:hypothetical protein